jgi:D-galactarolactone isomerase
MAANTAATNRPKLQAPPGSCDTHLHFYDPKFPLAKTAASTPPTGTPDMYKALQKRLGLERLVVVQPSAYGFDNSCTLAAIAAFDGQARGIAVVDEDVSDAELERLTKGGIRGVRFLMFPGGALPWDKLEKIAARVQPFGWHVILQFDGIQWPEREAQVRRVPGNLVIDHLGKFLTPVTPDHPSFKVFLRLLENGRTWYKLSAPYEISTDGPPHFTDAGALAKALVAAAPERGLWASNWPHPSEKDHPPDDAMLLDTLLAWAPDEAIRHRILVDNPAQLYGFT